MNEYLKVKYDYIKGFILKAEADRSAYNKAKAAFYTEQGNVIKKFAATYNAVSSYRADRMKTYIEEQFRGMSSEQRFFFEKWKESFNIPEAKTHKELMKQLFEFEILRDGIKAEWIAKNEEDYLKAVRGLENVTYKETWAEYSRQRLVAAKGTNEKGIYDIGNRALLSNMTYREAKIVDPVMAFNGEEYFNFVKSLNIPTIDKEMLLRSISHDRGKAARMGNSAMFTRNPDYARPFHNPLEVGFFVGLEGKIEVLKGKQKQLIQTFTYEALPIQSGNLGVNSPRFNLKDANGKFVGEFEIKDNAYIESKVLPIDTAIVFTPKKRGYNLIELSEEIHEVAPKTKKLKEKRLSSMLLNGRSRATILKEYPQYSNIPHKLFNVIKNDRGIPLPKRIKMLNKYAEVDFTRTVKLDATENKMVFGDAFARDHIL